MRRLWLVLILGALAVSHTGEAKAGAARLDPSFGQGGVVSVQPPLPPPFTDQYIRSMAAARGGDSFVLFERYGCGGGLGCFSSNNLFHYRGDGALDHGFDGPDGSYELPQEGEGIPVLAVDSDGRPLLAQTSRRRVVVSRLTPAGTLDRSFGGDGTVELGCKCGFGWTRLLPGPRGTVTVALSHPRGFEFQGTVLTLVRLAADGSVDRSFGGDGRTAFGLQGADPFAAFASTKRGALYLGGDGCCESDVLGYVVRVSARGRLDRRFTAASRESLRVLRRLGSLDESVTGVVVRPGGRIDVLGSAGFDRGFMLRLNSNGHLRRKFGGKGMRTLPLSVSAAALGSDGAVLAVADGGVLTRILAGGRPDPAFGRLGQRVPGGRSDSGISVVPQAGRRALVLDLGLKECRGYCPAAPKLARFIEGPRPKRR